MVVQPPAEQDPAVPVRTDDARAALNDRSVTDQLSHFRNISRHGLHFRSDFAFFDKIIANYPPFVHMGNLFGKLILQIENRLGLW